jgi:hypothetical protein
MKVSKCAIVQDVAAHELSVLGCWPNKPQTGDGLLDKLARSTGKKWFAQKLTRRGIIVDIFEPVNNCYRVFLRCSVVYVPSSRSQ